MEGQLEIRVEQANRATRTIRGVSLETAQREYKS